MNMTNVLHRRKTSGAPDVLPPMPDLAAPPPRTPGSGHQSMTPWPMSARVLVAALTITTVLAAIGVVMAVVSSDDGATERELGGRIEALTNDRDDAVVRVGELDAQITILQQELHDSQAGSDELTGRVADLEARIATLTDERSAALRAAEELTVARDAALAEAGVLTAALATANERLTAAVGERDALAARFPTKFDASLDGAALVGRHDVKLSALYCSGLPSCARTPTLATATISRSSAGNLRLAVPSFVDGGLFAADGALHLVADSTTAVPACSGAARSAGVVMTVFPAGYQIARDGTRTVTGLNAVITVEAPATAGCSAGLAFYSAELTPTK